MGSATQPRRLGRVVRAHLRLWSRLYISTSGVLKGVLTRPIGKIATEDHVGILQDLVLLKPRVREMLFLALQTQRHVAVLAFTHGALFVSFTEVTVGVGNVEFLPVQGLVYLLGCVALALLLGFHVLVELHEAAALLSAHLLEGLHEELTLY